MHKKTNPSKKGTYKHWKYTTPKKVHIPKLQINAPWIPNLLRNPKVHGFTGYSEEYTPKRYTNSQDTAKNTPPKRYTNSQGTAKNTPKKGTTPVPFQPGAWTCLFPKPPPPFGNPVVTQPPDALFPWVWEAVSQTYLGQHRFSPLPALARPSPVIEKRKSWRQMNELNLKTLRMLTVSYRMEVA